MLLGPPDQGKKVENEQGQKRLISLKGDARHPFNPHLGCHNNLWQPSRCRKLLEKLFIYRVAVSPAEFLVETPSR